LNWAVLWAQLRRLPHLETGRRCGENHLLNTHVAIKAHSFYFATFPDFLCAAGHLAVAGEGAALVHAVSAL
jgi:hypothetical protein